MARTGTNTVHVNQTFLPPAPQERSTGTHRTIIISIYTFPITGFHLLRVLADSSVSEASPHRESTLTVQQYYHNSQRSFCRNLVDLNKFSFEKPNTHRTQMQYTAPPEDISSQLVQRSSRKNIVSE